MRIKIIGLLFALVLLFVTGYYYVLENSESLFLEPPLPPLIQVEQCGPEECDGVTIKINENSGTAMAYSNIFCVIYMSKESAEILGYKDGQFISVRDLVNSYAPWTDSFSSPKSRQYCHALHEYEHFIQYYSEEFCNHNRCTFEREAWEVMQFCLYRLQENLKCESGSNLNNLNECRKIEEEVRLSEAMSEFFNCACDDIREKCISCLNDRLEDYDLYTRFNICMNYCRDPDTGGSNFRFCFNL